jgi:Uma2 family endonuclease
MAIPSRREATIEDLYNVPEGYGAELVNGEIVLMSPTGDVPNSAAGEIYASLRDYARRTKLGRAYTDNATFIVTAPRLRSFSPDTAFYIGPRSGMKGLPGPPVFAVEVRSENDYGPAAERAMAQKRAEYFASGTLVVWDVDTLSADVVKVYRADNPTTPTLYRRGDTAEAEPAVPGWSIRVDALFE